MKTYINGQHKSADTEMATKYQLSRAYTKVQTHINTVKDDLSSAINSTNTNLNALSDSLSQKQQALIRKDNELSATIDQLDLDIQAISSQVSINISNINSISGQLDINVESLNNMINAVSAAMQEADQSLSSVVDIVKGDLSAAIDNTNATILSEKENIINILTNNDNVVSAGLEDYVNEKISNLGTVYELKGFYTKADNTLATSIADLPTSATVGQIYSIQNAETGQTEQYICISGEAATLATNKWQKFGTNVDLKNYVTSDQMITAHQQLSNELIEEINRVSGILNTSLITDINTSLSTANQYADTQDSQVLTNAKTYTDQVSSAISGNIDDLSGRLTNDIEANSKEYTNLTVARLTTVYCPIRKIEEITGAQPDFGTLSGNTTYKFTDPLQSLTVNVIQDSDLQTLVYFTTASTFVPGIPLTGLIDNGIDFTNIQPDTKYVLNIRNSIGKIEKIK